MLAIGLRINLYEYRCKDPPGTTAPRASGGLPSAPTAIRWRLKHEGERRPPVRPSPLGPSVTSGGCATEADPGVRTWSGDNRPAPADTCGVGRIILIYRANS